MQRHDPESTARHLDPDTLALLALGEPVATDDDHRHLASCDRCSGELAELGVAARVARDSISVEPLAVPSAAVWSRIQAELRAHDADDPGVPAGRPAVDEERLAPVTFLRSRRRWGVVAAAAAAVAVLVAGAGIGWSLLRPVPPEVVASATLEALPAWPGATGDAVVERLPDGERVVRLTLDAPPTEGDYREAWLLTGDASALVSLGVVSEATATLAIPDGIDLEEYELVDVSAEPTDGDPTHSGDSIVRGRLGRG
jgi:anti-sigma-K factor RskA